MKLRNKKTGEIVDLSEGLLRDDAYGSHITLRPVACIDKNDYEYESLADFVDNWEDYKPLEPLIKDEKIRKAVRAWAEANNVTKVWHEGSSVAFHDGAVSIIFHEICWERIPKGEYTLAELCGEEKE